MEFKDITEAYNHAISAGKNQECATFFAKTYWWYFSDELHKEYDKDPEKFHFNHDGKSIAELALSLTEYALEFYEDANKWKHSDEWAYFYATDGNETKEGAYNHIRSLAPETVYSEAYNEYIARGFSEKYASLMASEITNPVWHNTIREMEDIFAEYEKLYLEAKRKNKSDDFADFYADYSSSGRAEGYSWVIALVREKLQEKNKSAEYINNVIYELEDRDGLDEEMFDEKRRDFFKVAYAFGYADGLEYAASNK